MKQSLSEVLAEHNYFDHYENYYAAMAMLHRVWGKGSKDERALVTRVITRLREAAWALIPYQATLPNRGWDGRYI
jgi:hypothetical protein